MTNKKSKLSQELIKNREKVYSVACILLIVDQLVKLLIRSKMSLMDEIVIIPHFFSLYYVENTGAAFSLFSGATVVLVVLGIGVLAFLHLFVLSDEVMHKWKKIGLGMVIGGIVGNLVDRILYGAVIDYLSFDFFGYSFPIFNIADIGITIGFLILVIDIFRGDDNEFRNRSNRKRKKN